MSWKKIIKQSDFNKPPNDFNKPSDFNKPQMPAIPPKLVRSIENIQNEIGTIELDIDNLNHPELNKLYDQLLTIMNSIESIAIGENSSEGSTTPDWESWPKAIKE